MPSTKAIKQRTLSGIGNHIKLLPTGTVFLIQFLSPLLTNNGECNPTNKLLSILLITACGISCIFASFTDSYVDSDGVTHYGIVTRNGLWPAPPSQAGLPSHRLSIKDFAHAFCTVLVFVIVVFLDRNSLQCFNPSFESKHKTLLKALPVVVGVVTGAIFAVFPNNRQGIGHPHNVAVTPSSSASA